LLSRVDEYADLAGFGGRRAAFGRDDEQKDHGPHPR
jgi:hypothetical protein